MPEVTVYGADWCGDCIRSKRLLEARGIAYLWKDIQAEPDLADFVVQKNIEAGFGPKRRIPLILVDEQVLSEPSDEDLLAVLGLEP